MDINQIVAQLKSFNPEKRKQALAYLAKHGEKDHLRLLRQVYESDPEPVLREYAKQAAIRIRQRMEAPPEPEPTPAAPVKPKKLQGAEKAREYRAEVDRKERSNLWLFGIVALIGGGLVLWLLLGRQVLRVVDESSLETHLAEAPALLDGTRNPTAEAQGLIYHTTFSGGGGFYVQEGRGPMPPEGWTLILAVFSGDGRDALGWLTRNASEQNFMLLTPYVSPSNAGISNTSEFENQVVRAVNIVRNNYQINNQTMTAYGYLRGANFLSNYTARQGGGFAIVSLAEATAFNDQPHMQPRYYVLGSADNEVADVTINLLTRLRVLNLQAQGEQLSGISDADLQQRQWDRTLALIKGG